VDHLGALFSSASVHWATPAHVYDALNAEFHFTLDPCATKENAKCAKFYTKADDGLSKDWSGERVFMNPQPMKMNNAVIVQAEEQQLFQVEDGGAVPTSPLQLYFKTINYQTAMRLVKRYHYLHRSAPTTWSFGAYYGGRIVGVITIGKPASHTLISGVAGKEKAGSVYELNRLWMDDVAPKNSESRFIGWAIRQLPVGTVLVSYADTKYGHTGKVYQSTNWIYTGQSIPFTDYTKNGLDHRSIPKDQRIKSEMDVVVRSRKNRYVYFTDKSDEQLLRWERAPYPKP